MKKFICKICEYSTNDSGNFCKHNQSKKHVSKVNSQDKKKSEKIQLAQINTKLARKANSEEDKSISCDHCGMFFNHKSSLSRHKKTCTERKFSEISLIHRNEMMEQKTRQMETQMEQLKTHLAFMRQMVISTNKTNGNMVASTLYEQYPDNPPLKEIEYMKLNGYIRPNSRLVDEMISCFKHNTLHEFLGNFILELYKKKNYSEQSLFASDVSRLNYIVKEMISENISEWVPDKKGIKVVKYIINPLTQHVKNIMNAYMNTLQPKKFNPDEIYDVSDATELIKTRQDAMEIIVDIDDGKLNNRINKFICCCLVIDKKQVKPLNRSKGIPSLGFDLDD